MMMTIMHINRITLRMTYLTTGIPFIILFSIVCAPLLVKQNYYLTQDEQTPTISFGGYEIRLNISAGGTDNKSGHDIYGFFLEAIYSNKISDTMMMDSIKNIQIDSLCIEMISDSSFCLAEGWRQGPWLNGKTLYGKQIAWKAIRIPDQNDSIRVSYSIQLLKRINNTIVERKEINFTLFRFEKMKLDISR
ncbi:hypothetical protein TRIP_C60313 [Candidatus Zixiibacteriota bacterium]|nr:hypothetical protein TRIP_C60313 [candidate division Zixibacteria bacterium]